MTWIIESIEIIPQTILTAILAAAASIMAVVLTNKNHEKRLQGQLTHERELKRQERELSFRKEIYLGAVEAFSTALAAIGNLTNTNISEVEIATQFGSTSAQISKVKLIANKETNACVSRLSGELNTLFLKIIAARAPLTALKDELEYHNKAISRSATNCDGLLELMKNYNINLDGNQERFKAIEAQFKIEDSLRTNEITYAQQLSKKFAESQMTLSSMCAEESLILYRLFAWPAIKAMRNELGVASAGDLEDEIMDEINGKQEAAIAHFFESMKTHIPEIPEPKPARALLSE